MIRHFHIVISLLLLTACGAEHRYKEDTEFLKSYLSSTFDLPIPAEEHFFLFIPETGCKGCVQYASSPDLSHKYADNVTLIHLFQDKSALESDTSKGKQYMGTIGHAFNNDIYAFNVTLFQTSNERIDTIYDIDANNIIEVFNKTIVSKTHKNR